MPRSTLTPENIKNLILTVGCRHHLDGDAGQHEPEYEPRQEGALADAVAAADGDAGLRYRCCERLALPLGWVCAELLLYKQHRVCAVDEQFSGDVGVELLGLGQGLLAFSKN